MNGHMLNRAILWLLAIAIAGCAGRTTSQTVNYNDHTPKCEGQNCRKIENLYILIDGSGSLGDSYKNRVKLIQSKEIVALINAKMPEKNINYGLRTYGLRISPVDDETQLVYGISKYDKGEVDEALATINNPMGRSPLIYALNEAAEDLKKTSGNIAVIVITDAKKIEEFSERAAELLRRDLGDRVYVHAIQIGDNPEGLKTLEKVAAAAGTGITVTADYLRSDEEAFNRFICYVFTSQDSDFDGICNESDWCLETPAGAIVDKYGCSEQPPPAPIVEAPIVEAQPVVPEVKVVRQQKRIILNVLFDFDKWNIRPQYHSVIADFAGVLKKFSDVSVVIEGHTDSRGMDKYNEVLSQRRADSVRSYLVDKFDIDPSRIKAIGYGESRPIADNKSIQGRQKNRRIEALVLVYDE